MNILIVSTYDIRGGAAIAAFRLMQALRAQGENARLLVREKLSDNEHVFVLGGKRENKRNFYWERARIFFLNSLSRKNLFDISIADTGGFITEHPLFREADIVHLHWINQGMLSLAEIKRILASGKKVVWTMHDMWPFTGICHHAAGCSNYQKGCGNCHYLKFPSTKDLSRRLFLEKESAYASGKIHFVACSQWLKNLAGESPLTQFHSLSDIPNPLNISFYAPKSKIDTRKLLGLPLYKKIVLFAAVKASDKRKGVDYLIEASQEFENRDVLFMIAGTNGEEIARNLSTKSLVLGYISPENMPNLYRAADLFVTPSLQENLPNTIMEAMACGTPCVGFETGGIPEMIYHTINGYVAQYRNAEDLARGIRWILFEADSEELSENARSKVVMDYAQEKIANRYLQIYGGQDR